MSSEPLLMAWKLRPGSCYADPQISWKSHLVTKECWQRGSVDISPLTSHPSLHPYPRAKVALQLRVTGPFSLAMTFLFPHWWPPARSLWEFRPALSPNELGHWHKAVSPHPKCRETKVCGGLNQTGFGVSLLGQAVTSCSITSNPCGTREAFFP